MNILKAHPFIQAVFFFIGTVCSAQEISTKGAIIIASVEGQVTVVNNDTQVALPASSTVAGGVIYDGHTVKTGPSSKVVLLLTNGTMATVKSESSLNIKKFTQEKFDTSKTKLSELKGEPSRSNTVIDIEIGDMVVDVKKLDKKSSFNIESPVGTAGIRGTVPAISVTQLPDGGFQQQTAMLRGEIAFTPRGGNLPTMLGPGQSLFSGIGPNGAMLPMQLGQVSAAMMSSIQADVEAAGAALGLSPEGAPDSSDAVTPDAEDDVPTDEELNESDDKRKGASKGVGDDDNGTDAVALEKAGLIDLDDPDQASKADSFVEVSTLSANSFDEKNKKEAEIANKQAELAALKEQSTQEGDLNRRNSDVDGPSIEEQIAALEAEIQTAEESRGKSTDNFVKALSENIDDVVDVTLEMESIGIKDPDLIAKTTENAENAPVTKSNVEKAKKVGVEQKEAFSGLLSNPETSNETAAIFSTVEENGEADLDLSKAITEVAVNADISVEMKAVTDQLDETTDTTSLFSNIGDAGKIVKKAKDSGTDVKTEDLAKNVAGNAEVIVEMKAVTDQLDETTDTGSLFTNIGDAGKIVKKAKDSGTDVKTEDLAKNVAGNADVIVEMKAVTDQLDDSTDTTSLFTNIGDAGKIVKKAKDSGTDVNTENLAKSVAGNADVIVEMKAVTDQLDDTSDAGSLFSNIGDAGKIVKKAKDSGTDVNAEDLAKSVVANADVIVEMKAITDQLDDSTDTTSLFTNIGDAGKIVKKAKDSGSNVATEDLAKSLAGNADVIVEMKEVADQLDDSTDTTSLFNNLGDAGKIMKKAKDSGSSVSSEALAKNLVGNADVLTEMRTAADQLDKIGDGGDADSLFTNLADVGKAVKKAKDLGVEDEALVLEMTKNPNQAAKVNQAFDALGDDVDADGAKNLLGNAASIDDTLTAIGHAKESGADLKEFVKKDVSEHKAVNQVVAKLKEAGGDDAASSFLQGGIDDALQLNQAFEEGHVDADSLAESVKAGNSVTDAFKAGSLNKLQERFANNPDYLESLSIHEEKANDILFALSFVEPGTPEESALMGNLDKLDAIMHLSHRFEDSHPERLSIVFENLDVAIALDQLVIELSVFPDRLDVVFENADLAPAILATYIDYESVGSYDLIDQMFSSSETLRNILSNDGLNKLLHNYPGYAFEIESNSDRAGEISGLISQVGDQHADQILGNLDKFDDINLMILRTKGDPEKIKQLLEHLHILSDIKVLSDQYKEINLLGGQDAIFANLSSFDQNPEYLQIASDSPKFFVRLADIVGDLNKVSPDLAIQLKDLDLSRSELEVVVSDLLSGPQVEGPSSAPPSDIADRGDSDISTLSFLTDHYIPGSDDDSADGVVFINPSKVVDSAIAFESSFFTESADLYYELSDLSSVDQMQDVDTSAVSNAGYFLGGVLGGRNIEFNPAIFDLSNLSYSELLVAASGSLTFNGDLNFVNGASESLTFLALEKMMFAEGGSVSYAGDSLGFGSLDSIEVINVDLHAEGEISIRSLDSLVINNSDMRTSGNGGADFVHLLAASELSIDNLRFSDQVRQIAMEAMTINLSNLNFPAGSQVQLNSLYGGIDGIYPNFGNMQYGRVNFIDNVRYNSNLINSVSTFDQFGANISIGKSR